MALRAVLYVPVIALLDVCLDVQRTVSLGTLIGERRAVAHVAPQGVLLGAPLPNVRLPHVLVDVQ